jgi:hypothetical protein
MTEPAKADYRDRLAGPRAVVAQGVEGCDASAHQGRRIDGRQSSGTRAKVSARAIM